MPKLDLIAVMVAWVYTGPNKSAKKNAVAALGTTQWYNSGACSELLCEPFYPIDLSAIAIMSYTSPTLRYPDLNELASAIRSLVPEYVAVAVESFDRDAGVSSHHEPLLHIWSPTRQAEFSAGRQCARMALGMLGANIGNIGSGLLGEPLWPPGFQGTISHDGDVAAALAFAQGYGWRHAGMDLLLRSSCETVEWRELADLILAPTDHSAASLTMDSIVQTFCMKEAAIKVASPLLRSVLDFRDLRLSSTIGSEYCIIIEGVAPIHARFRACAGGFIAVAWLD